MSGVSDFFGKAVKGLGEYYETVFDVASKVTQYNPFTVVPASRTVAPKAYHELEEFAEKELTDKSELRGAELETFLRGFPIIGGILNGFEGINLLEDLFNRTGKIPAYPGLNIGGASGISKGLTQLTRKIESGVHDLAEFYSGEKLGPLPVEGKDYITGDKYVNQ